MKKLTIRHLRENMGRTVITVMGIIVSVAMITAVFVSAASFLHFDGEVCLQTWGNAQVRYDNVSGEQLEKLRKDERVDRVGSIVTDEDEISFRLNEGGTDRIRTGNIYSGDTVNLSQVLSSFEGKLPENDKEIAVEKELIEKNGLDWEIGDQVEIPVGVRTDSEGNSYGAAYSWTSGELFAQTKTRTFRITALLDNNPGTRGYDLVRGLSEEEVRGTVSAMVSLKNPDHKALHDIREIAEEYGFDTYATNDGYLESLLSMDENSTMALSILPMTTVILVLIIIASVLLIYNAFGMSLSERVRYLGMLASVGATRRQKRGSVYFEGFLLGAIGIPLGIFAGIIGIYITLRLVGQKLVSTGMINGVSDSGRGIDTVVPLWAVAGVVLFSVVTIFISSFIPARKASRITPIDAIRQNQGLKIRRRKLSSPRYIRWIFGYEGELAHKSLKRNGRKSSMITISITLSVVLFLCVNYFTTMFSQTNEDSYDMPYQITVTSQYQDKDTLMQEISELDGVDRVYGANTNYYRYTKDNKEQLNMEIINEDYLDPTYQNLYSEQLNLYVHMVGDEDFRQFCDANGIDSDGYFQDSLKGILMNNVSHREGGSEVFNEQILGKVIGPKEGTDSSNIEIAAFAEYDEDYYFCHLAPKNCVSVYVPESTFYKVYYAGADLKEASYSIAVETEEHERVTEEIQTYLDSVDFADVYVSDLQEMMRAMNTVIFVLDVFIYGFIVLITLITIANIINTISTGILLRKREFAMLKSVGMTPGGFRKMICMESLFYGMRALIFGLPISAGLSYLMNKQLGSGAIPYEIDIPLYLAVVAAVFLLIGMTMFYAVTKVQKGSIIETLKEEIS